MKKPAGAKASLILAFLSWATLLLADGNAVAQMFEYRRPTTVQVQAGALIYDDCYPFLPGYLPGEAAIDCDPAEECRLRTFDNNPPCLPPKECIEETLPGNPDCSPPRTCGLTYDQIGASVFTYAHFDPDAPPDEFIEDIEFANWEDACGLYTSVSETLLTLWVYATREATGHYDFDFEVDPPDQWQIKFFVDKNANGIEDEDEWRILDSSVSASNSSRQTIFARLDDLVDLNTFDVTSLKVGVSTYVAGLPDNDPSLSGGNGEQFGGTLRIDDVGTMGVVGSILRPTEHGSGDGRLLVEEDPDNVQGGSLQGTSPGDAYDTLVTDPLDPDYYLKTFYETPTCKFNFGTGDCETTPEEGDTERVEAVTFFKDRFPFDDTLRGWEGSNLYSRLWLCVTRSAEGHVVAGEQAAWPPDKWWIKYSTSNAQRWTGDDLPKQLSEPGRLVDSSIRGANRDKEEVCVLLDPEKDLEDLWVHVFVQRVGDSDGGVLRIHDIRTLGQIPASLRPTQADGIPDEFGAAYDCTGGIANALQFDRTWENISTAEFNLWEDPKPCRPFSPLRMVVVRSVEQTDEWSIKYTIDGNETDIEAPGKLGPQTLAGAAESLLGGDFATLRLNVDAFLGQLNMYDIRLESSFVQGLGGYLPGTGWMLEHGEEQVGWLAAVLNPTEFTPDKISHLVSAPPNILAKDQNGEAILTFTVFAEGGRGEDQDENNNKVFDSGEDTGFDGAVGDPWDEDNDGDIRGTCLDSTPCPPGGTPCTDGSPCASYWNGELNGLFDMIGAYRYRYAVFTAAGKLIGGSACFECEGEADPRDSDVQAPFTAPITREINLTALLDGLYEVRFMATDATNRGGEDRYLPAVYRFSIGATPEVRPKRPIRFQQEILR